VSLDAPRAAARDLASDFDRVRDDAGVPPAFPADVLEEARRSAGRRVGGDGRDDLTGVDFLTVDPPGSRDLDQAMHLERSADGYVVLYAIADVAAFVPRGGAVEAEAWRRGVTVYAPDRRTPLYPPALSEGAASLLPGETRPAIVFRIELDGAGERTGATVRRAVVRSRRQLTYEQMQGEGAGLLEEIGAALTGAEERRGGMRLDAPAQRVVADAEAPGGYRLDLDRRLPVEDWNAQISLLAGMTAADLMLRGGAGLLRVVDEADARDVDRLRPVAAALGVEWEPGEPLQALARRLHPGEPHQAALQQQAREVLGRADYAAFAGERPARREHAGVGAPYAHTTAPLRRLADRYVLDLLVELGAGRAPAAEVVETLGRLPKAMAAAEARAHAVERGVVDAVEARVLAARRGERFRAVVIDRDDDGDGAVVTIADPPIRARLQAAPPPALGATVDVVVAVADPEARRVQLALAP
jgi:exoribonuclease R